VSFPGYAGASSSCQSAFELADLERSFVAGKGQKLTVDLARLWEEGDFSQNASLEPDDYICVASATKNEIYVPGEVNDRGRCKMPAKLTLARSIYAPGHVNRPGPVSYEKRVSLLSAVAVAGRTRPDAIVTKALIIRGGTHRPKVAVVDIRALMRGKESDLALQGGDIVRVPASPWTKLKEHTEAVLVTAAQTVADPAGLGIPGVEGDTGVTINAGGGRSSRVAERSSFRSGARSA
jgi:hypothetical protein